MKLNSELTKEQKEFMIFKFYSNFDSLASSLQVDELFLDACQSTSFFLRTKKLAALVNQDWIVVNKSRKKHEDEFKDAYNRILDKWVDLFLELNFRTTLEITSFFTYLMWQGYFSYNREYCYDTNNRANIDGWHSLDVISGHGVCLNESSLLKDFLLKMGIDAALIINYAKAGKVTGVGPRLCQFRKMEPVKKENKLKYMFNRNWLERSKNHGNHTIVLVKEDIGDKLMLVDPTNIVLANIINPCEATGINGKVKYKLNPLYSYALAHTQEEYRLLEQLYMKKETPRLTAAQYDASWLNAYFTFQYNQSAIEECYQSTIPAIKEITKKLERYRKK